MNRLFVCTLGENRSRTAAEMFGGKYCGISDLTDAAVRWADRIYVFERAHAQYIKRNFPEHAAKVVELDISSAYRYGDAELKSLIEQRMAAADVSR